MATAQNTIDALEALGMPLTMVHNQDFISGARSQDSLHDLFQAINADILDLINRYAVDDPIRAS
jgi:hypothetical protein